MKKIIVPVDFSEHSAYALDFAIQFNEIIKGKITLLHVLELPAGGVNYGGDITAATAEVIYRRELIDGVSNRMHELEQKVQNAGQEASIRVEFGTPFKSIGKQIEDEGADWVIMGSKGSSGLAEVFLGSNAERVIRYSKCPVITVKGQTDLSAIKSMVFPTDMLPEQDEVAAKAKEFQSMLSLNMHLLRVKTPYNFVVDKDAFPQLEDFAKKNDLVDYTTNTIEAEFAEDGIIEFARDNHVGIIVMGTHGRTGLAHMFGGSRAEDVANHAQIPVLTFRIG